MITGRRGSGKTTQVQQRLRGRRRIVVFDPVDEYGRDHRFGRADTLRGVLKRLKAGWSRGFKIAYVPRGDPVKALHGLSMVIWQAQQPYADGRDRRKITLVAEELNLGFPATQLPKDLGGFRLLTLQGRHRGVEIVGVTQRPAEISATFRGQVSDTWVFPLGEEIDIQRVLKQIGRKHETVLRHLRDHHFIKYSGGQVTFGKNPRRRKY
ncbi:MAG: hypothetical protein MI806_34265 [Minwuiales bacterium]|nr:hypothetical protein [Minwuiales bacterium]